MSAQSGSVPFQPRARLIRLLGDELITNEVIAVVELVKNSFDADATKVQVILENITDIENGVIVVQDNGVGMNLETILGAWMQPGTDIKKKSRERKERSKVFQRPILGEKGVGRFAAQKLGTMITLITRSKDESLETLVEIDWKEFEKDKLLSNVLVKWVRTAPKIFRGNETGTRIEIRFLGKIWSKDIVDNLVQQLGSLQSPFQEEGKFEIELRSNDFPDLTDRIRFPEDLLEKAIYSFSGSVSDEGIINAKYDFCNSAYPELKRTDRVQEKDIRNPDQFKKDGILRLPTCGRFSFRFYVWDLELWTLKESIGMRAYKAFIQPNTGIRIYRDNFRVWPYGEKGNDWLDLNKRRVNNPPQCLSNNQVIGIVEVTQERNPALRDKTDREGFLESLEYRDFCSLVEAAISELEVLRRKDKDKTDKIRERKVGKKIDETLGEVEKLRKRVEQNSDGELYGKNIDSIEKAHNNYVTNTVYNLLAMAGVGIAALMPAHEVQVQLKDLKPILGDLKEQVKLIGLGGKLLGKFDDIDRIMTILWEVSNGALELGKREHKVFTLRSVVDFSLKIKGPEMRRELINYEVIEKEKISLEGYPNLVITAINNLIDNSIWWLQKKAKNKNIRVTIKRNEARQPSILVSDNGPGIDPSDLDYLGEAFFTRKPRGTGLGLFICRRCMEANNGKIDFGFYPHDPDYLQGANVLLIFEEQERGSDK